MKQRMAVSARQNLIGAAKRAGAFEKFIEAVGRADLVDLLRGPGPFTVFAPTDEAVARLPAGMWEKLLAAKRRETLRTVLALHIVDGRAPMAQLAGKRLRAVSREGEKLRINAAEEPVTVNGALVTMPDVAAANGVIHGIGRVLWPSAMMAGASETAE